MLANFITVFRVFLCFIVVALLISGEPTLFWAAFVLTIIVIWFDGLDGYVARKFNQASKFGAVLDILCDRLVENIYWITFACLGWLPLFVPLVVVTSKIGRFIVASNFCRFTYAITKALAFAFLILANFPVMLGKGTVNPFVPIAYTCAYIAVVFCVVRGIPVVIESKRFILPMMAQPVSNKLPEDNSETK